MRSYILTGASTDSPMLAIKQSWLSIVKDENNNAVYNHCLSMSCVLEIIEFFLYFIYNEHSRVERGEFG